MAEALSARPGAMAVRRGRQARVRLLWLGGALACLALWGSVHYLDRLRLQRDTRAHLAQLAQTLDQARAMQKEAGARAVQLANRSGAALAPLPPAAAMLAQVQQDLRQAEPPLREPMPEADDVTAERRSAFLAAADRRRADAQAAQALLARAQDTLGRLEQMLAAQFAMLELQRQYSEAVLWNAPLIRGQVREVQQALELADGAGAAGAERAVKELGTQLARASTAEGYLQELRGTLARLDGMGLSGDDRKRLGVLANEAATAAMRLDAQHVKELAAQAADALKARQHLAGAGAGGGAMGSNPNMITAR